MILSSRPKISDLFLISNEYEIQEVTLIHVLYSNGNFIQYTIIPFTKLYKDDQMKKKYSGWFVLFLLVLNQGCKVSQHKFTPEAASIRQSMLRAMAWQEANPIYAKAPTDWTNGAYYLGVSKAHEATKDTAFLKALKQMAVINGWKPWERFYHADDMNICYSYLYLKRLGIPEANLQPSEKIINEHLYNAHPWKNGISGNKLEVNEPDEKSILWWWCDALFMAPPVITAYSKFSKNESLLNEMDKFYKQSYELLYDKEQHLFSRDMRFLWKGNASDIKEPNGRKVFWSRGNGWVLAGLALILADMPKQYPNRVFYENLFMEMALKIKELQPEDGLWRTSLLCPESYDHGEVSGSGFYTFALAWGINNNLLDKSIFKPVVLKAWKGIMGCQKENGKIGWVQNIGANPMPANAESWQNFGTGAFLLAGSEMIKLR
jgi:rhamnogalacturonyl hydrolase YesR